MPLLRLLHWLPIKQRIVLRFFKPFTSSSTIRHQCILMNVLSCVDLCGTNLRSNADPFRLTFPMTHSKAGDQTFTVSAAKEWNELPSYIKSAETVNVFKKILKTYLFPN